MNIQEIPEPNETIPAANPENLREMERIIASAIIFSSDGKMLMGLKAPNGGGVWPDDWHIPGGGTELGETLEKAAARETREETGLDIKPEQFTPAPFFEEFSTGSTVKVVDGERRWCIMRFNRFEVHLDQSAEELEMEMTQKATNLDEASSQQADLKKLCWFSPAELADVQQIPGGKDYFVAAGYIKPQE